jgi:hypothetical protein
MNLVRIRFGAAYRADSPLSAEMTPRLRLLLRQQVNYAKTVYFPTKDQKLTSNGQ